MDPISFFIQLVVAVVLMAVSVALTPRTKSPKPEVTDLEDPTAEAGREIPVVFGTVTIDSPNVLWFGEKSTRTYGVK